MTESEITKEDYKRYLRVIYHNTGGSSLPAAIPESAVGLTYSNYTGYDSQTYETVIEKGVEEGHTIRIKHDGEIRVALTVGGIARLQKTTPYNESNLERMQTLTAEAECVAPESHTVWEWMDAHRDYCQNV